MTPHEISLALQELSGKWIPVPQNNTASVKAKCPFCMDTRGNPADRSLYIRTDTGLYHCYHCNTKGVLLKKKEGRKYERPKREFIEITDQAREFFRKRGLPESILDMRIVGSYMNPYSGKNFVTFNYYKNDVHVNTKYRNVAEKAFQMEANAELCLYNGDALRNADEYCVITEGELDALSWIACGYLFTVSVPNGASNNTGYMDDYIGLFKNIKTVYIATDGDDKGVDLAYSIADRIGREKCLLVKFPYGVKDTNDILQNYEFAIAKTMVEDCFNGASPFPIDGIETVQDNLEEAYQYLIHGYPETYSTGIPGLDRIFRVYFSEVTIITAAPNSGKSNLVDAICVNMSKIYGFRTGLFSAEKTSALHITELVRKYIGKQMVNAQEALEAMGHLNDHFFYITSQGLLSIDDIIFKAEQLVKTRGIRILVIDNLSYVKMPSSMSMTDAAADLMAKINGFAKRYRIKVFLVAHPRKLDRLGTGFYPAPDGYDILGSGHYFNLAHNIIAGTRVEGTAFEVYTRKIKNMAFVSPNGDLGKVTLEFDFEHGGNYNEVSGYEIKRMHNARNFSDIESIPAMFKDIVIANQGNQQELDF
jgi:twinkle protein